MNQAFSKDLFAVLGVAQEAGPEVLRKAYLALAVKYHPDRNPGNKEAEERFKEISQAYAILSDPTARARYQRQRPQPTENAESSGRAASSGSSQSAASDSQNSAGTDSQNSEKPNPGPEADFEEVLAGFFNTAKGRETLKDLEEELSRSGLNFKINDFSQWVRKNKKPQSGDPSPPSVLGRLVSWLTKLADRPKGQARSYEVMYQISLTSAAAASGTTVEISYRRDENLSKKGPHHLKVKIPAGTKDGDRLRLAGQGRLRPDQSRGDLILTINVGRTQTLDDLFK